MLDEPLVLRADTPEGVTTLTLNKPDKLNALDPAMFIEFRAHVDAIAKDRSVGCVIVTGAGRSFCAGHDLDAIADHTPAPTPHFESETVDALEQLPQPTIAKIKGHCFTGGLEFAVACDILIAADDTKLGDTHGQWGLVPVWGLSVRLPERVGLSMAKELMFTSRRITGTEAAELGLIDHAVPADDLDARVDALATEIVANSWGTNRIDKLLLRDATRMSRNDALINERRRPYGAPDDLAERMKGPKKR